jgi:hypothetical protein
MGIFFDSIANVKSPLCFNISGLRTLSKGYTVHDAITLVVYEFKLDVFLTSAYDFACAIIIDALGTKYGASVAWSEGGEAL